MQSTAAFCISPFRSLCCLFVWIIWLSLALHTLADATSLPVDYRIITLTPEPSESDPASKFVGKVVLKGHFLASFSFGCVYCCGPGEG